MRLAINGFGRIGRCVLRALLERRQDFGFDIVAINEPADLETIAYLTRYDSTHGRLGVDVEASDGELRVGGQSIAVSHELEIGRLAWQDLGIDLVLECSGAHTSRSDAQRHLDQGAGKLLFSHPATADVDATVVCGVNEELLQPQHRIVSNASCTTNCIAPVLHTLHRAFGIQSGHITTLHSLMNDQPVIDAYHHTDLRKTRSASESLIPVDTELARGIARILPELDGRLSARAVRVPTRNVSAMDLVVQLNSEVDAHAVNQVLQQASEQQLAGILGFTTEPLASIDFNHDPHSGTVDATQTSVSGGRLLKVFVWFDNEWGFANRMLETSQKMLG